MINLIFICVLGSVTKEIKSETADKECRVMIGAKQVGSAQHNMEFCPGLASRIKLDMERKGFKCESKNIK